LDKAKEKGASQLMEPKVSPATHRAGWKGGTVNQEGKTRISIKVLILISIGSQKSKTPIQQ
jgi:hypothetical protein